MKPSIPYLAGKWTVRVIVYGGGFILLTMAGWGLGIAIERLMNWWMNG